MLPVRGPARPCSPRVGGGLPPVPVVGGLSVVGVHRPQQFSWRGPGVRFRGARCRRRPPLLPVLPGGRGKFLRRASPSFWAGRGWLPRVAWRSTTTCSFSSTPRQEPAPSNTRQQPSAASPRKESTLETPYRLVATVAAPRRDSRVVPAATAAGRRACRDERQPAPPLPPAPRVLEGAGRCGLRRGYLALPSPTFAIRGFDGS